MLKKIVILMIAISLHSCAQRYSSPSSYTPFLGLRNYAVGANPGNGINLNNSTIDVFAKTIDSLITVLQTKPSAASTSITDSLTAQLARALDRIYAIENDLQLKVSWNYMPIDSAVSYNVYYCAANDTSTMPIYSGVNVGSVWDWQIGNTIYNYFWVKRTSLKYLRIGIVGVNQAGKITAMRCTTYVNFYESPIVEPYQPLTIVAATANYVIDDGGGNYYFSVAGIAGKPFKVDWGDGTISQITFTDATITQRIAKTYASAGTYNVKIYGWNDVTQLMWVNWNAGNFSIDNSPAGLTYLFLDNLGTNITGSLNNLPAGLTFVYLVDLGANITGSLDNLPAGLTFVYLANLGTNLTGSLDYLPAGLTVLNLQTLGTNITGSVNNLPAGLTSLTLDNLGTNITYTSPHVWALALDYIRLEFLALDVTEIDNILCDVANSNNLTGTRTLILTNNAIPSAAGLNCKTTLQTQGWTVTTD